MIFPTIKLTDNYSRLSLENDASLSVVKERPMFKVDKIKVMKKHIMKEGFLPIVGEPEVFKAALNELESEGWKFHKEGNFYRLLKPEGEESEQPSG